MNKVFMGHTAKHQPTYVTLKGILQHVWGVLQHVWGQGGGVDTKEVNRAKLLMYYNINSPKDKAPYQPN